MFVMNIQYAGPGAVKLVLMLVAAKGIGLESPSVRAAGTKTDIFFSPPQASRSRSVRCCSL